MFVDMVSCAKDRAKVVSYALGGLDAECGKRNSASEVGRGGETIVSKLISFFHNAVIGTMSNDAPPKTGGMRHGLPDMISTSTANREMLAICLLRRASHRNLSCLLAAAKATFLRFQTPAECTHLERISCACQFDLSTGSSLRVQLLSYFKSARS